MLKISTAIAAVILTAGAASAGETRFDVDLYRANPVLDESYTAQNQVAAYRNQDARAAFAYAPGAQRAAPDNAFVVYRDGHYAGQDPDFNVRLDLQRQTDPR